jgi:dCTP deaminase
MLRLSQITARLNPKRKGFTKDPFFIVPCPTAADQNGAYTDKEVAEDGAASIDLRLGTWFLVARQDRVPMLEITKPTRLEQRLDQAAHDLAIEEHLHDDLARFLSPEVRDAQLAHNLHVRFGEDFILHPRSFVLGVTLEWLRLPSDLGGYVTGRSSWGRRGLVIATATGVHPGFTGCLTLELANLGDVPIAIRPGMTIGQLFLHDVRSARKTIAVDHSGLACKRKPRLGHPQADKIAQELAQMDR